MMRTILFIVYDIIFLQLSSNKSFFTIPGFDIIQQNHVWSFDILDPRLYLIANQIVKNKRAEFMTKTVASGLQHLYSSQAFLPRFKNILPVSAL